MKYKIKSRIWIEADNSVLLGEGRVHLLKAIDETGSLSKAAKRKAFRGVPNISWQIFIKCRWNAVFPVQQNKM